MKKNKIFLLFFALLMVSSFLLNSLPASALADHSALYSPGEDSLRLQKTLSAKDQAVLERFAGLERWLEEQSRKFKDYVSKALQNFQEEVVRVVEEFKLKIEEWQEQLTNKFYRRL
ncbi:MAG: hypothetical protein ACOX3R_00155 [Desulfitobacteriia bacterium]|jgi:peptidoglycan hydrolase CwlO-like protein